MNEVKFTHLTDLHLPLRENPNWLSLLNKRALGYLSWRRKRSTWHRIEALDQIVADMMSFPSDAALITGDIVNLALPAEFSDARRWMDKWFSAPNVIFTPGNHDAYVKAPWSTTLGQLSDYMTGERTHDHQIRPPKNSNDFPFTRRFSKGPVTVIAVNSSPPTAPGLAIGILGSKQIARLEEALFLAGQRGDFRILLIHHPPNDDAVSKRKALVDRKALRAVIEKTGVELILHGHAHKSMEHSIMTPTGPAPVIGGASASHAMSNDQYRPARYNRISIARSTDIWPSDTWPSDTWPSNTWRVSVSIHELDMINDTVNKVSEMTFERPTTAA
ncbi:MAG: metallophosphoesterase [Pseudomonadota bacterium]